MTSNKKLLVTKGIAARSKMLRTGLLALLGTRTLRLGALLGRY